ncbi:acyl-CoA dehydrogenase [Mycoavidus sp. B2-EB]|uniref:acyl-CoA dehydrogenase n=1 Tax=Mycoavidus sp. B2-EB TaxID=2651972 RepID=UPI001628990C|nr:acyl-CoA dehydrogenase [Mycoavidus sp. B2-EB]BBO59538.1 acyl-CoA dehydrogenase [Mycoavidus sp. B2-EB]
MSYNAPLKEIIFAMQALAGLEAIAALPGLEEANLDLVHAILDEAAKFNHEIIAPLNRIGDCQPALLRQGAVTATPGFKQAFAQFTQAGWQGIVHPPAYGGQGLPKLLGAACNEILNAANLSFALCPLLTDGAIEALLTAGSEEQKKRFVPLLISGAWTGTMNLTESQAGSDLALIRTRAQQQDDGTYKLFGTKIFITYGEHDLAANILHLVLARTSNAPDGVKGLSLFLVPKFLINQDGSLGARNDVHCVSLEHKLGIHASPTAVLQYGDQGGAIGYLIGAENRGLESMFIMMNAARFAVGMQGVALAERAYQHALAYAKTRLQGRPVDGSTSHAAPIIKHPDVRRMLMTMRALTEGARALAYYAAALRDYAEHAPEATTKLENQALYEYLVPIVKGWNTELASEVASLGVQVHGGMGFIEETGAAQYYRDARILSIYEGTTAIQANDLVGRKTVRDGGAAAKILIARILVTEAALAASNSLAAKVMHTHLRAGRQTLERALDFVVERSTIQPAIVYAGAVLYLKLAGTVLAGWQMARALLIAQEQYALDETFYAQKSATAHFFATHILTQAPGLGAALMSDSESIESWLAEAQFS